MGTPREDARTATALVGSFVRGRISRREFLALAAALPAGALLASSAGAAGASVTIPFYTTEGDPVSLAVYRSVIARFRQQHPEADVKINVYQDEDSLQILQTAFRTGTDVGVFVPPAAQIAGFAAAGYLLPLSDVVQKIGTSDFLPGTRIVVGGEDYAIPYQANASALYYRKDLLDGAGIKPPRTYDEYLAAAKELNGKDGAVGISSSISSAPQQALQFFAPYIYQSGWDYFGRDGSVLFDRDEVLAAVRRYVAVMRNTRESFYNAGFGAILTTYISGKGVFATFPGRLGVNCYRQAPEIAAKTGVIGLPAGPFMTGRLHYGGIQRYVINRKTGNPGLAKEFLLALASGDNALAFALTVPGHLLPGLRSVGARLRQAVTASNDPYLKAHGDWVVTFLDLASAGALNPATSMGSVHDHQFAGRNSNVCPWGSEVWTSPPVDGTMLQSILINNADPGTAWRTASEKMRAIATKWKKDHPDWKPA